MERARAGAFGGGDRALGWAHEDFHLDDKDALFAAVRGGGRKIDCAGVVTASRLYTPGHIVAFLLQNTLGALWLEMHPRAERPASWRMLVAGALGRSRAPRPLRDLRILDPCCGCGAFLLAAYDMLVDLYARERALTRAGRIPRGWAVRERDVPAAIVAGNLWGADLDSGAVDLVREAIDRRGGPGDRANLRVVASPLGSLDRQHAWRGTGFDVVVANPPYVGFRQLAPEVIAAVTAADPLARSDLAIAFQSRCWDLLGAGGLCGTVTPAAWLTSRASLPLRERVLAEGGPRVTAALGQRVFDGAPLLFVGLSVLERGGRPGGVTVLRPRAGSGAQGIARAVRDGGRIVGPDDIDRLRLRPFLPAAPPALLALAGHGPAVGELFTSFDGVWTGDNSRDVRYWWELAPDAGDWRPLSGGQGHEPWSGPILRRIHASHAAGQPPRAGTIEYARVAGGRLAARLVDDGAAALAGIVTLVPRSDEARQRIEEVLAIFNSRIGTAWLRTLSGGLNFNPGYAAEIPLGRDRPPPELRDAVRRLVALRAELARRDPTADAFVEVRRPWTPCELVPAVARLESEVELLLAEHLGIGRVVLDAIPPVARSRRRGTDVDDYLMVRLLRALGTRWPGDPPDGAGGAARLTLADAERLLRDALEADGAPDLGIGLGGWLGRRLARYHASRFRQRPFLTVSERHVRLITGGERVRQARSRAGASG